MSKFDGDEIYIDRGSYRLEWTWEDEGLNGDYNPEDPDDVALLRFTILKQDVWDKDTFWPVEDCSYCTQVEYGADTEALRGAGIAILQVFATAPSKKKAMETMSWIKIGA